MLFLTGGSGFVGSRFIELYPNRACITALERKNAIPFDDVRRIRGDLLDIESLVRGMKGCRAVVHVGGATPNRAYREQSYDATVIGTKNLLEAARTVGIRRFIFVSTDSVSGSQGPYALSKLTAEREITSSDLDWTIFRPRTIVGSGARDLGRMMKFWSRARWIPVIGDGTCLKQPVFVDDLCRAIAASLEDKDTMGRIITVAGEEGVALDDFVSTFARQLGNRNFRVIHLPLFLIRPAARLANRLNPNWGLNKERVEIITRSRIVAIDPFRRLINARPAGFEEMVARTVTGWLKAQENRSKDL